MRRSAVAIAFLLGGCASLSLNPAAERTRLWEQAHDAYGRDSLRVAAAAFQRLASDHARSHEGHEARFYLGVLALEPNSGLDPSTAPEQFSLYLAQDSAGARGWNVREARTLLRLSNDLRRPCADRLNPALRCGEPAVRVVEGAPAPEQPASAAEAARLRREIAEQQATIRRLRDELERIRNTLAPRRTPR